MADKKIIKAVKKEEREIITYVAGGPANGRSVLTAPEIKVRADLFDKLIVGHSNLDINGVDFPDDLKPSDLILKNSEWNVLKQCFEVASYPTMSHAVLSRPIETRINEAEDYKG